MRKRIVDIAYREYRDKRRNREQARNCNYYTGKMAGPTPKFCKTEGFGSGAWCANFAEYVWKQAGANTRRIDSWAHSFLTYGKRHRTWHRTNTGYRPQPGDAVVYKDRNHNGKADHVGLVTGWKGSKLQLISIEGNWKNKTSRRVQIKGHKRWYVWGYTSPVA